MSLSITRVFTNLTSALGSYLDENFAAIVNYVNAHTTSDKWNDAVKCGGYTPNGSGGPGTIPVTDANGTINATAGAADAPGVRINGTASARGADIALWGDGATTPNKFIRAKSGALVVRNSANSANIATLSDAGDLTVAGNITGGGVLKEFYALVSPSGTIEAGSLGTITVTHGSTGFWSMRTEYEFSGYVATFLTALYANTGNPTYSWTVYHGSPELLEIWCRDSAGALADVDFYIHLVGLP